MRYLYIKIKVNVLKTRNKSNAEKKKMWLLFDGSLNTFRFIMTHQVYTDHLSPPLRRSGSFEDRTRDF